MIEDAEIGSDCLHISSGTLDIPVAKEVSKRFLVLYLKHLNRFTEIEISDQWMKEIQGIVAVRNWLS